MIPVSRKFPMRTDFVRFRARAKRLTSPHLTLSFLSTNKPSRLAVVVPAKVSKLAATRNWLKRLSYDTLWPLVKDEKLDCVVICKPLPLHKSPATKQIITEELNSIFPNGDTGIPGNGNTK